MEIKRNDATRNRPEGDRVIDAPYIFIDIPACIKQLMDEKAWEKNDRNGITVFKSDEITVVVTALQKDAEIIENTVDGFMLVQVLSGKVSIITPDGDVNAGEKNMIAFHPCIPYSIKAVSDAVLLLTNYTKEKKEVII